MDLEKIALKLQETTDKADRNEGRIKKLEHESAVLHQLATSVAVMAEQMKGMNSSISTLMGEVEEMKEKPRKRWDAIVEKALTALVAAIVGFLLAQIGIG